MNDIINLNKNWMLEYNGKKLPATVPGDITLDLYNNGIIENPYFGTNHKDLHFIIKSDVTYTTTFDVDAQTLSSEEVILGFDGIDTFADIYLNDRFLGHTEDMFLKYEYSVKDVLKEKNNVLTVKMLSTQNIMDQIDDKGYFGVFNVKRLFIRKAQCHFGWDWAPDMPGYGIIGDVTVKGVKKNRLDCANYKAYNDGSVTLFAELNYTVRPYMDFNGNAIKEGRLECKDDLLRFTLAKKPNVAVQALNGENAIVHTVKVTGKKNFTNFFISDVALWYPSGYGEHPLYAYKIELLRNNEVIDELSGNLAFREVKLLQKPQTEDRIGYKFEINGKEVFVKGSNWVPAECFIGSIKDEKYERLIQQAVDANFNMLRVWGGGLYEKDIFYDICDKKGIMVWQDLMFACADIPEDDEAFCALTKKEIEYQIKRLRTHPSIVYWCGGNEKTGSYGLQICRGDYFVDVFLRGIVLNLDDSRPYARQSPCSLTDIGNDKTSGESHAGSFESSLGTGVERYRDNMSSSAVPFVSECAIMGASSLETTKKFIPEDKLFPLNEVWDDRLMDNPYAAILMTFAKRQEYYATALYGDSQRVENFIAKSMTVHAETMRAEIEFARANVCCGGFMNWMFSDIWPSATWAVVDYYCEPKQVYYQMKRSYRPLLVTFVQNEQKQLQLVVANDSLKNQVLNIHYGLRTLNGETVWGENTSISVESGKKICVDIEKQADGENVYLFAEYDEDGQKQSVVFSYSFWRNCKFSSNYEREVERVGNDVKVTVKAKEFVKGVTLRLKDNYKYTYSDNYFDLQAKEEKVVYIYNVKKGEEDLLEITDFAKECL